MQQRKLGRTGLDVSPIAIGGAAFSYVHRSMGWDPMSDDGRTVVSATLNTALDQWHQLYRHRAGVRRRLQ